MRYYAGRPYLSPAVDTASAEFIAGRARAAAKARQGHWFWLPCPLCGIEFGGHESSLPGDPVYPSHIPDPGGAPASTGSGWVARYQGICPFCTAARRGWDWPDPFPVREGLVARRLSLEELMSR